MEITDPIPLEDVIQRLDDYFSSTSKAKVYILNVIQAALALRRLNIFPSILSMSDNRTERAIQQHDGYDNDLLDKAIRTLGSITSVDTASEAFVTKLWDYLRQMRRKIDLVDETLETFLWRRLGIDTMAFCERRVITSLDSTELGRFYAIAVTHSPIFMVDPKDWSREIIGGAICEYYYVTDHRISKMANHCSGVTVTVPEGKVRRKEINVTRFRLSTARAEGMEEFVIKIHQTV